MEKAVMRQGCSGTPPQDRARRWRQAKGPARSVRGVISACFLVASLLFSAACLGACASAASEARASLDATLQQLHGDDVASSEAAGLLSQIGFYPEDYGVSTDVFLQQYFKQFDHAILDATQDGDYVLVDVQVTVPKATDMLAKFDAARGLALAQDDPIYEEGFADEFYVTACDDGWDTEQLTFQARMVQEDGQWMLSNEDELATILLDGYDPRQIDAL